jgi:hypothetical protein
MLNDPGRKRPSPAPRTAAIGTRTAACAVPSDAVSARAATARVRAMSEAIMTFCGPHRSLAYPPAVISRVRGMP